MTLEGDIRVTPIDRSAANEGLQVKSGNTLALVGGNVDLAGGVVTAPEGQVALGSANNGRVSFTPNELGWKLGYEGVENFQDINLSDQAAVDASGLGMGSIQMVGREVRLTDGSIGLIQNQGSEPSGEVSVSTRDLLEVRGTNREQTFPSILANETFQEGTGGNIAITTRELLISDGGTIFAKTFGAAPGGDVFVSASDSVKLSGFASSNPRLFSALVAVTNGLGNAGNMTINTKELTALSGGTVTTTTLGTGSGGNLSINASESVTVSGIILETLQPAAIASAALTEGGAGQITINTSRLTVTDGAVISTSTLAQGSAGSLIINASDFVEVSGRELPTQIGSDAPIQSEAFRQAVGLPDRPSGDSGSLTINTPQLRIFDGARISVGNEGTGKAGNMQLNTDSILLVNTEEGINAATASGEGGNINITTDFLEMRRSSQISTEAGGTGRGGNIDIDAENIVLLENSNINANAFEGTGGNINITTEGLFQSDDSGVTASSEFGVSGEVTINTPEVDPNAAIADLPQEPIDLGRLVATGCAGSGNTAFTFIGRGGIPTSPMEPFRGQALWVDLNNYENYKVSGEPTFSDNQIITHETLPKDENQLIEATGWIFHPDGRVELVAVVPNQNWYQPVDCRTLSN